MAKGNRTPVNVLERQEYKQCWQMRTFKTFSVKLGDIVTPCKPSAVDKSWPSWWLSPWPISFWDSEGQLLALLPVSLLTIVSKHTFTPAPATADMTDLAHSSTRCRLLFVCLGFLLQSPESSYMRCSGLYCPLEEFKSLTATLEVTGPKQTPAQPGLFRSDILMCESTLGLVNKKFTL